MKKIKLIVAVFVAMCFTACLEITEEITLHADGSGEMNVTTDMSKMVELLKGFAGEEDLQKEEMKKAVDTTIWLRDALDSAENIGPEERRLLQNGKLRMQMNFDSNLLKMYIQNPFTNISDANKLNTVINQNGVMERAMKGMNQADEQQSAAPGTGIDKIGSIYDILFTKDGYSRTLNKAKYDSLMADPKLEEMKGMMAMMDEAHYTLRLKLPRAAKTVSNSRAVLSADKKEVTLTGSMTEMLDKPEILEIKVAY